MSKIKGSISNNSTKYGIVGTVIAVVAVLTIATYNLNPQLAPTKGPYNSILYPASIGAVASSCGDIYRFKPDVAFTGVIPASVDTTPPDPTVPPAPAPTPAPTKPVVKGKTDKSGNVPRHPMIVPVYGYLADKPLPKSEIRFHEDKDYKEIPYQTVLRTMYDYNTTVLYYDRGMAPGNLIAIQQFVDAGKNILALPWTYEGSLPLARNVAFASWGMSQSCSQWSEDVFKSFNRFTVANPVGHSKAPAVASLDKNGKLAPVSFSSTQSGTN